jgi:mannosyltransferase OCH1-like enzyme
MNSSLLTVRSHIWTHFSSLKLYKTIKTIFSNAYSRISNFHSAPKSDRELRKYEMGEIYSKYETDEKNLVSNRTVEKAIWLS